MEIKKSLISGVVVVAVSLSCTQQPKQSGAMQNERVRLIQLNPGHFHAALVQKTMYDQVDPVVHVYAPPEPDVQDYLARVEGFNSRAGQPASWVTKLYTGNDFLEKMLEEKAGNVMVTAGNNARKTEYIRKAVEAGLNVFADKPMVISATEFPVLEEAFRIAGQKGVLLYDIMTERYEITTILQRELSMIPEVFGTLLQGSVEEPAITKESVHHLFKNAAGKPVLRPGWFFDVKQQGTGLADVGTHLVDLVQWECFPEQIIDYKSDIQILTARTWATDINPDQFEQVTGLKTFPDFLNEYIDNNVLKYPCNGEMIYKLKGVHAKVSVIWRFQAPGGTGDTHYSIMRGSECSLVIRQGQEENFVPVLYIEATGDPRQLKENLETAMRNNITVKYPGVELMQLTDKKWKMVIPDIYKTSHEDHFAQVMEKYLQYLKDGKMPEWEVPDMIAKYYTTTSSVGMATLTRN